MTANSINLSLKKCMSCCGMRPATDAYYGFSRHAKGKQRLDCKTCVSHNGRYLRRRTITIEDDPYAGEPDHNLNRHNTYILNLGLLRGTFSCVAHDTINHIGFDAQISKESNGCFSVLISGKGGGRFVWGSRSEDGDMEDFLFRVVKGLKDHHIRLELSDVDLHRAIKEIYYI